MKKIKTKGFTLIELIVVLAIIGILTGLLITNYSNIRMRARDAQRKSDLNNVKKALRMYYSDWNAYPGDNNAGKMKICQDQEVVEWGGGVFGCGPAGQGSYMPILPQDPLNPTVKTGTHIYEYRYIRSLDGQDFCLAAPFENGADRDLERSQRRCNVAGAGCNYTDLAELMSGPPRNFYYFVCSD